MLKQRARVFITGLMLGDLILTAAAFGAAYYLRFYSGLFPILYFPSANDSMILLVVAAPLALILLTFFGAYEGRRTESVFADLQTILDTGICLTLVLATFIYLYQEISFSRLTVVLFGVIFFALFSAERIFIRLTLKYLRSLGFNTTRLLLVGAGAIGRRVLQAVNDNPSYGYKVVGMLDDHIEETDCQKRFGVRALGKTENIVDAVEAHRIDKVLIALPIREANQISRLVELCEHAGVDAEIIPDVFKFINHRTVIKNLDGLPLLSMNSLPVRGWAYGIFKRCFDITFSLLLLTIFSPLMALIAALIKLTSNGSIFFTQERIGTRGHRFRMIKFRTMFENAEEILSRELAKDDELNREWRSHFKLRNDPRITPIGSFLRKTSLDELPQLLNVLCGDMSLVGPRPLPLYHQENLSEQVTLLRRRVRPGMTGLWQISGRSDIGIDGMEWWDLYYVRNWSLWLDMSILFRTVPAVLRGVGAL